MLEKGEYFFRAHSLLVVFITTQNDTDFCSAKGNFSVEKARPRGLGIDYLSLGPFTESGNLYGHFRLWTRTKHIFQFILI